MDLLISCCRSTNNSSARIPYGTVCHNQLRFESLFSKEVVADFAGGRITSDAGGLLLRELDQRYRIAENAARCLHDPREGCKVKHDLLTLVRQRLFAIAQGYEDNNDAATLAKDPALKIMAGKAPESDGDLASQPTLSRFENRVTAKDLRRLSDRLLELYLKTHPGPRKVIVLDMDATDDPTHGKQQLSFFHGYYAEHMYHPLLVFDGRDGFPLAAVLRPGNTHSSRGALAVLTRLIQKLQQAYPGALILFRADAGFAVPALYSYLEDAPHRRLLPVLAAAPPPPGHGTGYGSGVKTLRLKLLKIGARIRETSRRIWVHLASGYPYRDLLAGLLQNLRPSPG
jgi:hypothetical protein